MIRRHSGQAEAALRQRLSCTLDALGADEGRDDRSGLAEMLTLLVARVGGSGKSEAVWLLLVALTGAFPTSDEVAAVRRQLELSADVHTAARELLHSVSSQAETLGAWDRTMRIVTDAVIVDVDFSAKYEHNTGIQRVVRETVPRWHSNQEVELVAWVEGGAALRPLYPHEIDRVLCWNDALRSKVPRGDEIPHELVVPLNSDVLVVEVPKSESSVRLAAMAAHTSNRAHLIGYDAIPIISADMLPASEAEKFASYLALVKLATRVVGISESAAAEFAGFARAVSSQGLPGPLVTSVLLPLEPASRSAAESPGEKREHPLVLCVGSHEGRKNHRALLYAAEVLWREGLEFELEFVGGGSVEFTRPFDREVIALERAGRPVVVRRGVSDSELDRLYRSALITVFPSLHEGYGLPVAESLSRGTPVITTNYGSTKEVAEGGGCLLVDPRDDESIIDALRRALTEPELVARLGAEAAALPARTWDDYATGLWSAMLGDGGAS